MFIFRLQSCDAMSGGRKMRQKQKTEETCIVRGFWRVNKEVVTVKEAMKSCCVRLPRKEKKRWFLYSAVSSPLDRSKRFTLFATVHSDTNPGFSGKHSSQAAITCQD